VRMRFAVCLMAIAICIFAAAPRAGAQVAETLMPEQSAAKAKHILDQVMTPWRTGVFADARHGLHGATGAVRTQWGSFGYTNFRDYWRLPDKNRTEYEVKGAKGGLLGCSSGRFRLRVERSLNSTMATKAGRWIAEA